MMDSQELIAIVERVKTRRNTFTQKKLAEPHYAGKGDCMTKGRVWPAEWREYRDHISGARMRQLTNYKGHSHHLYFTNPGWYDGARRLLFGSDRENRGNLFGIELQTGLITQLTDLESAAAGRDDSFLGTSLNPVRPEAYFWHGRKIVALDLESLEIRSLWEMPEGFRTSMLNATADGKYVCAGFFQDLSDRLRIDYGHGYVGFPETCEAHPLSRIVRVSVDGGPADVVWEEKNWIGHVNTSPTQAHLLTFCHEGPWQMVDHRIWVLDLGTGRAWKVRPREVEGERIGHEYWHADGVHLGYHGSKPDGARFFGKIRFDNTERVEVSFPHETGHIHSNDFSMVVGDGGMNGNVVRIWKWNGTGFDGPKVLCEHRSSFHVQKVHVHPRFSPDGSYVVYTSDSNGYGNVFQAWVPEFETLSDLAGVEEKK